jgi:hypothetical protein
LASIFEALHVESREIVSYQFLEDREAELAPSWRVQ